MRILFLAPHAYYADRGSPIDADILLRALSNRGDRVDALVYHEGEDRDYPNVTIHRTRALSVLGHVGPGFSVKKLVCDLLLMFRARALLKANRYDLIHAVEETSFMAAWFKGRQGIPYIYDMDSSVAQQMVEQMPFLRPLRKFFYRSEGWVLRECLAAAPVCNALAEIAHHHGANHVETLYDISLLDPSRIPPSNDLRENLAIDGASLIVLYVGNLEPYQGIDLLLESFQFTVGKNDDMHLVVAGGSSGHIDTYSKKAERLGIGQRTHFIGPWPADRLGELLVQADVLTVPRIRGVNTPMKVFPFMHSGVPVLATKLPTHTQILDESVAYLAEANPTQFGQALLELSSDQQLRESLGRAGQAFVTQNHVFTAHQERVNRLYGFAESALAIAKE